MAGTGRRITIEFLGKDTSAGKTASQVEQRFGKLGGKLDRVGRTAGKLLAGGTVLAAAGLVKMGQAAAEDEAAQVKLATSMRNSAGASDKQIAATERWIEAQGRALGVADDELRPALGRLVDATGDVGKAQELASLAMDISAGTGKSLQSVTLALVRAQTGSVDGLSRLGVQTKDATGKTKSLQQITTDLAATYKGQAAQAAETTAGKQKRLQVALSELGEEIGARVLPAMVKLSEIGLRMVDWVGRNQTTVGILVGTLAGLAAVVWSVSAAMRAWVAITTVWSAVTKVAATVQWALNAALLANPIVLIIAGLVALGVALVVAYKKSETFRNIVNGAFNAVRNAAARAWGWIKKNWPLLLAVLTGPVGIAVALIIRNWGKVKASTQAVWNAVKTAVTKAWTGIKNGVSTGVTQVMGLIRGIPGKIRGLGTLFSSAGKAVINAFVNGMKNATGIVSGIASNVWSALKGMLNSAIGKLRSALNFTVSVPGPDIHINVGNSIPYLAKGTRNFGGGLAVVGERGPELVGLPRGSNVYSNRDSRRMLGGGGGLTIVIQGGIDTKEAIGRAVVQAVRAYERSTGQRVLTP